MLNKDLLEEYVCWLLDTERYKIIESLFFQFFLEYMDVSYCKRDMRKKKLLRIVKLKELISIVLVKGEYHNIIHYLELNKHDIDLIKEFKKQKNNNEDERVPGIYWNAKTVSSVEDFRPLILLNYGPLRE